MNDYDEYDEKIFTFNIREKRVTLRVLRKRICVVNMPGIHISSSSSWGMGMGVGSDDEHEITLEKINCFFRITGQIIMFVLRSYKCQFQWTRNRRDVCARSSIVLKFLQIVIFKFITNIWLVIQIVQRMRNRFRNKMFIDLFLFLSTRGWLLKCVHTYIRYHAGSMLHQDVCDML